MLSDRQLIVRQAHHYEASNIIQYVKQNGIALVHFKIIILLRMLLSWKSAIEMICWYCTDTGLKPN